MPPKFAGQRNSREEDAPESLFPIYCATEPHQGEELSEASLEALRTSETLVVVASPEAANCNFMREEIRFFKEIGRADRIVVLMIAGEPHADIPTKAEFGISEKDECLAEELRYGKPRKDGTVNWGAPVEPICADVRVAAEADHRKVTTGQGYTNKVAYMTELLRRGIPGAKAGKLADEYEGRLDRAIRTLAAGILGFPAREVINESQLAAVKRLKTGLFGLGAAAAVLAALAIIGFTGSDSDSASSGNGGVASAATKESLKAANQVAEKLQNEINAMEQELAAKIAHSNASKTKLEREQIETLSGFQRGDLPALEVLEQLAKSSQIRLESIPEQDRKPENQAQLASLLETRATISRHQEDLNRSLSFLESSLALIEQNRAGYENEVNWLSRQSDLRHQIGKIRFDQSKLDGAEQAFNMALAIDERLAELEPEEVKWRQNLSAGQDYLAKILNQKGGGADVVIATETTDSASAQLTSDGTAPTSSPIPNSDEKAAIAETQQAAGDLEGAIASLGEAMELATAGPQNDPTAQRKLAAYHLHLGRLYQLVENSELALKHVREGLAIQQTAAFHWTGARELEHLAWAQITEANLSLQNADAPAAVSTAQQAVNTAHQLIKAAPQSIEAHSLLATAYETTAQAQQVQGQSGLAAGSLEAASDLRSQIAAAQPADPASAKKYVEGQLALTELHRKEENLDAAAVGLQKLTQTAARIYQQNPANLEWIKAAASASRSLSEVQIQRNDLIGAQKATVDAMSYTEKLANLDPENQEWRAKLQADYQSLGTSYQRQGNFPQAKAMLIRSAELARTSSSQDAASLLNLLGYEEQIANISLTLQENALAKDEYLIALATAEQVAAVEPENLQIQAKIAEISKVIGDLAASLDDVEAAEQHYARCLSIAAESANLAPQEDIWWSLAGDCHNQLGALHQKRGNLSNAKASYEAALQAFDYLAQRHPQLPTTHAGMALSFFGIGDVATKLGNVDLALRRFQDSCQFHQKLASAEPENVDWQSGIAESSLRIGQIFAENRNRRDAIAWLNSAQEQIEFMQKKSPLREQDKLVASTISAEIRSLSRFRVLGGAQ